MNPNAPGRGPGRLDATYTVELINGEMFIAKFIGVVVGTEKANDLLLWEVDGLKRKTRYGDIVATGRIAWCPQCGKRTLMRKAERDWRCALCLHETEKPARHEGRSSYAEQRP